MDNIIDTSAMEDRLNQENSIDTSAMEDRIGGTNTIDTSAMEQRLASEKPTNDLTEMPYRSGDDNWDSFVENANQMAKANNFPASVLIGQAALETGRGTSPISKNKQNYFGMNAVDSNPDLAYKYNTPGASVQGYIDMITQSPRYSWAYQQYLKDRDPVAFIKNIKASGYATDPIYAEKVMNLPEFKHFSEQGN